MIELEKGYAVKINCIDKLNAHASIVKGYLFNSLIETCPICVWRDYHLKCWKLLDVNTGLDITPKSYATRKEAVEDFENSYATRHALMIQRDKKYYGLLVKRREKIEKECNL